LFFRPQRSQDIKIEGLLDLCIFSNVLIVIYHWVIQRARNSPNKSPFLYYSWFYRADELSNRVKSYMWQTASGMSPFCVTADFLNSQLIDFIAARSHFDRTIIIPIQSYSEIIFNCSFLSDRVMVVINNNINNVLFDGTSNNCRGAWRKALSDFW